LHTAEAEADTQKDKVLMEITEAWALEWEIKMEEDLAEAEDLTTTGHTAEAAEAEAQQAEECQEEIQLFKMELEVQDIQEALAGDLAHLEEALAQIIAGLHGLEWAAEAAMENMDLQAAEAEADLVAEADLQAEELEAHKHLLTLVDKEWMEQVLAEAVTIALAETAQREVLA
jgi:hypothetical protein